MDRKWLEHDLHDRAPAGGEVGVNERFYRGGEFEPFYIPRPEMPQVDEADLPELVSFIRDRGIAVIEVTVNAELLRFHQKVDMKKVHAMTPEVLAKPILTSIEDWVLDGNHRTAGHKLQGTPATCLKVMTDFRSALKLLYAFPKTYSYGDGNYHPIQN